MKAYLENEVFNINSRALHSLSNGDFLSTQKLFRENSKKNRCYLTLHNLGVFYFQEGITLKNGKTQSGMKLGIQYLLKAKALNLTKKNLMALADAYLVLREFEKALFYYEKASEQQGGLETNFPLYNNFGKVLYLSGFYDKAVEHFLQALNECRDDEEKTKIFISYAHALIKTNKKKCLEEVKKKSEIDRHPQMFNMDIFILLYFCSDYKTACNMCGSLIKDYHIDNSVLAMVFDCLISLNRVDEARECLQQQIKLLNGYEYNIEGEVKKAKLAFESRELRKKLIEEYRYIPPTIQQCYYIGCAEHNLLL